MSTPRRPSRLAEYSANGSFYPRELTELGGILYFIDDNGVATPVNEINHKVVDSGNNVIGTFTNKTKSITIPDATAGKFGLVKLSDDNAKQAGTAAPGTSSLVARADHVHPTQTTITGNAGSATKLQTARTITFTGGASGSGSFDGSKNISIELALQGLSDVATSGLYSDLTGAPTASDTAPSAAGTANAGKLTTYARADHVHPVQTSVSGNAGTATKLANARTFTLSGGATGSTSFDGSKDVTLNVEKIDASKIEGIIDIANIPQGALERLVPVANEAARLALTTNDVQNGDVVKEQDTGLMYYVVDDTKLGTASKADAFEAFTAGSASVVPWTGVTGKPNFATVATSGSYNDLADKPTLPDLSLTATGSGNVLTGISVKGHAITVTKNITALTAHPSVTKSTDGTSTSSPAHGGTFTAVDSVTRDTFGHVTKINTKTVTLPSETGLSIVDDKEGNFISGISVSGHKITLDRGTALTSHQTIPDVTVDVPTTGNALTGATAAGHKITFTKGTFLTAHPGVNTTADPSDPTTQTSLSHGGTFIVQSALTRDGNGHVTAWSKKKYQLPSETKLSLGTQSGSGNVVTGIAVNNHTITVTKGNALTSETALSKESDNTTGNFVTDITVSGHKITVSKGNAITSETKLSLGTQSGSGNVVTGIAVDGHKITVTKGITALTAHQTIPDVTVDVPTTGNALTGATAAGHKITFTKGTFLTAHPAISKSADDTTTSSPEFGGTFTAISGVTRDGNGHVTKITTKTVSVPSVVNASTNGIGYGTCTTAAATTAKTATLNNYVLKTNGIVAIRFTYGVPASATLNINGKGAKAIYYNNAAIAANVIKAGDTATFIYNGSYYMLLAIDKTTITSSGSGNVVTGISATGNNLTITKGITALTSETKLGLGTQSGSGNVVTGIAVNNHTITVTKGITALTAHPTISKSTDSTSTSSPSHGGTFTAVDSITRDGNGHVTKINTKTVTLPSQTTLSKSTSGSGEMVKDLTVSGHAITVSKGNPSTTYTAAVGTTWTGSEAPYTQTIAVSGMTATDNPIVDVVLDSNYDTATTELEEYAKIYKITTAANSITVYATDKTENAINIQLKVVK